MVAIEKTDVINLWVPLQVVTMSQTLSIGATPSATKSQVNFETIDLALLAE